MTVRRWLRDASGSTAIEFAIVFPTLMLMVAFGVEVGSYFFHAGILESAATRATYGTLMGRDGAEAVKQAFTRRLLTMDGAKLLRPKRLEIGLSVHGTSDSMYKRSQIIHNPLSPEEPIYIDANRLAVTGAASSAEILQFTVTYRWEPVLPFTTGMLGWLPALTTRVLMRYEPI